jgi:hypothetical protein
MCRFSGKLVAAVHVLARIFADKAIAGLLNRNGLLTGKAAAGFFWRSARNNETVPLKLICTQPFVVLLKL